LVDLHHTDALLSNCPEMSNCKKLARTARECENHLYLFAHLCKLVQAWLKRRQTDRRQTDRFRCE